MLTLSAMSQLAWHLPHRTAMDNMVAREPLQRNRHSVSSCYDRDGPSLSTEKLQQLSAEVTFANAGWAEEKDTLAQKHGFSESCGSWVFDWDPDSGYVCVRARTHAGMDGKVEGGMVTMMEGWCGV